MALEDLKSVAKGLGLPVHQTKEALIASIKQKLINAAALQNIMDNEGSFRKNRNTLPRIINFILQYPDAVMRSGALSTRLELQYRETGQNNPLFVDCVEKFNDYRYSY